MLRILILDGSRTLADDIGPVAETTNLILRRFVKSELLLDAQRER